MVLDAGQVEIVWNISGFGCKTSRNRLEYKWFWMQD